MYNLNYQYYSHYSNNYYGDYRSINVRNELSKININRDKIMEYFNPNVKQILVPTDFSQASSVALDHAIHGANQTGASITLLNLCKSENELKDAQKKMEIQSRLIGAGSKIKITEEVRIGSISEIPKILEELNCQVVFIGTHGTKGANKIFGSPMLKLISKSNKPYLIVQKNTPVPKNKYSDIIFPNVNKEGERQEMSRSEFRERKVLIKISNDIKNNFLLKYRKRNSIQDLIMNKFRRPVFILSS